MKVRDVMSGDPISLKLTATLREAAIPLADESVGGCPVVDPAGRIVGMLSEVDILEALKTQNKELRMLMPPEITFGISSVEITREGQASSASQENASLSGMISTKEMPNVISGGMSIRS